MDPRDCLAYYPFVVVRLACRYCSRAGSYRLARLAAKFGPETSLAVVLDRFSYDCLWREDRHGNPKRRTRLRRLSARFRTAATARSAARDGQASRDPRIESLTKKRATQNARCVALGDLSAGDETTR